MPTQAIPQGKHEAFESQFAVPHGCRNFTRDEGGYVVRQIESMWQAWLAGRASLAAIPAPEMPRELGNPWRDAVLEALTVNCIRKPEHEDDSVRSLADLVKWERDETAGSAPLPPVPGLTDEQIETWADGFIREKAFNRPVALAIAFEAAKFARAALSLPKPEAAEPAPIDMVLHCPKCGAQHVDAPEGTGTFYGTDENPVELMLWDNPPHKSHFCHACGYIWRPADVPTNGVLAINTKGKDDSPIALAEPQESVDARPVLSEPPSLADVLDALNVFNKGDEPRTKGSFMAVAWLPEFIHNVARAWYSSTPPETPGHLVGAPYPASKAIEFAEYMAKRASELLDDCNAEFLAKEAVDEFVCDDALDDAENAARGEALEAETERASERCAESMRALRSAIYEFRKRAEKVGAAAPSPQGEAK